MFLKKVNIFFILNFQIANVTKLKVKFTMTMALFYSRRAF